jgi:hypothetical protein
VTDRSIAPVLAVGGIPGAYSAVSGGADGVCFIREVQRRAQMAAPAGYAAQDSEPNIVAELVRNAQRSLQPDFMTAFVLEGSFAQRALRGCGFRWTVKGGANFVANALAPDLPLDPTKLASWSLSLCDLEFF